MTYESIAYLGYAINTVAPAVPASSAPLAPAVDIAARCQLLMNAIEGAAKALAAADQASTVLKVFSAPESFFNSTGEIYTVAQVQEAVDALQAMVAGTAWADWVFAFGSIAAQTSAPVPQSYRFCLVQQGGPDAGTPLLASTLLTKFAAQVDVVNMVTSSGGILLAEAVNGPGTTLLCDGAGVFPLAGLTWGLDLRDPATGNGFLRAPCLPPENAVAVQLVLSRGQSIRPQTVAAAAGGYVFSIDGSGAGAVAASVGTNGALAPLSPASTCAVPGTPLDLGGSPPTVVPVSALFPGGPGMVTLYAGKPLPATAAVTTQVVQLTWPATTGGDANPAYAFNFSLVYDAQGNYLNTLCEVICSNLDFMQLQYTLPCTLACVDGSGDPVSINLSLGPGSDGYDFSVQGMISVPGFVFEGAAIQFSQSFSVAPYTIW